MRLFISYARVDKPYCVQIANMLDAHEAWADQRLYAGQNWWSEILRRLDWCEGFVYLLSPESVASDYCRREFGLARSLGRHIFPVLVQPDTQLPDEIKDIQYADLSRGLTGDTVRQLLNAIYLAERQQAHQLALDEVVIPSDAVKTPAANPATVIDLVTTAMERAEFDQAVFLLKQAKENGFQSSYFSIDAVLAEAIAALERQTYLREAEREYKQIAALARHNLTARLGCEAFQAFHRDFPDYDPENLAVFCIEAGHISFSNNGFTPASLRGINDPLMPLLQWCEVSGGEVCFQYADANKVQHNRLYQVESFLMSKYPITNAQYRTFLEDRNGYANPDWWDFSRAAMEIRQKNSQPIPSAFNGDENPREMVNWYDAVAFCRWLGDRVGREIMLPTVAEWQRAYQGDDQRQYPWGNLFNPNYCNTSESQIKMTTLVNRYPENITQFGVCDMAGNVWEWCVNVAQNGMSTDLDKTGLRIVRGGSYMSPGKRSEASFYYAIKPETYYASIGFRVVCRLG